MKIKLLAFSLLLSFSFSALAAKSVSELRKEYMVALADLAEAPRVYDLFLEVDNPTAQVLAYKGALEAIMTRTTSNVFKKLSFLRKSEESFEKAVAKSPNNLEIRFMRMAVQHEIPRFLGMSDDIQTDKEFVIKNISKFEAHRFPKQTLKQIYDFMKRCNYFTTAQIKEFRGYLALN